MSKRYRRLLTIVGVVLILALLVASPAAAARRNPFVFAPGSDPYGMTYGEWGAEWWKWAVGIPADQNPILDATGEFGHIDQSGRVWFLAGTFGGEAERTLSVPKNKALFFPLLNSLWWAPDDLETARFVAQFLGLNPAGMTDEELIRLVANFASNRSGVGRS